MRCLQGCVLLGRHLLPRGWSPVLLLLAKRIPYLRRYPASLADGTTLYLDLSQRMCHGVFFLRGQPHEYGTEKVLRFLLKPGSSFVDVGANVGYYTVLASQLVGPTGSVVAIEPQPEALSVLQLNAHRQAAQVHVSRAAASDSQGKVKFYVRESGDTSSLLPGVGTRVVFVDADTLDSICEAQLRIDLIKIDVEGTEFQVLNGATGLIQKHRPWIHFEVLSESLAQGTITLDQLAGFFRVHRYECHWVDHSAGSSLVTERQSTYILATPSERTHLLGARPKPPFV